MSGKTITQIGQDHVLKNIVYPQRTKLRPKTGVTIEVNPRDHGSGDDEPSTSLKEVWIILRFSRPGYGGNFSLDKPFQTFRHIKGYTADLALMEHRGLKEILAEILSQKGTLVVKMGKKAEPELTFRFGRFSASVEVGDDQNRYRLNEFLS